MDIATSTLKTLSYSRPANILDPQIHNDMPFVESFAGDTGQLVLNTDFVKGTSFIGTKVELKIQNLFKGI